VTRDEATSAVEAVLEEINAHRWRDVHVPHGFYVRDIEAEPTDSWLGRPAGWTVCVDLGVPVLYSPDSSRGVVRAALPATRDNLDALRDWIVACARQRTSGRARLASWRVTPDEPPAPYKVDDTPNGPPADWAVTAVLEIV
jgi:hypothetical protein